MVRYRNGLNPVWQLRGEMDRLFGDFFGRSGYRPAEYRPAEEVVGRNEFPPLNVWERDEEVLVEAEIPGVKSEDLEISATGNELSLKGRRPDVEEQNVAYHRRERGAGDFHRIVRLPAEIDSQKVEARLTDGVLLITLPKAEVAKPKKITIRTK